jgi:hypothetical protein
MGNQHAKSEPKDRDFKDLNFTEEGLRMANNLRLENNDAEFTEDLLHSVLSKYVKRIDNDTPAPAPVDAPLSEIDTAASPFITNDIYNYLQNKALKNQADVPQAGGASKRMTNLDEDSSTSDTSSTGDLSSSDRSSDDVSDSSDKKHKKHKKDKNKSHEDKNHHRSRSLEETSQVDLSYLSSSAHTGGEFSDTQKSVTNENHKQSLGQDSINTSDINMVSEY